MNRHHLFVLLALAIAPLEAATGEAHTFGLTCANTGSDNLQGALTGAAAWTAIDGGAGGTITAASGDVIQLTGICQGDIVLAKNGAPISALTIVNSAGNNTVGNDGINGQVEVRSAALTLKGLVLEGGQNNAAMSNGELANVYAHDGAAVTLDGDTVGPGPLIGVFVTRASSAQLLNASITGVGTQNAPKENDGLRVDAASSALVTRTTGQGPTISGNGGNGVTLLAGSSLEFFSGTVQDNGGAQIYATGASNVTLSGVGVGSSATSAAPLVQILGGSSATIDTGSAVQNTGGGTVAAALLAASTSSIVLNATTVNATGASQPVIEASGDSSIILAGGNSLSASASGGTVLQIDHSSSLQQVPPAALGYAADADTVSGSAFVQVQSSMDVGVGPVPETDIPSLIWSVPPGNCILVQQNSAFRMSGGVLIAGAGPAPCALNGGATSASVVIQQESNAFFNLSQGGTDSFTGGGAVQCLFAGMPNAHVTGKANISPSSAQPIVIGSLSQALSATSPGCLGP
jgi:hypothetical protein